MFGFMKRILKPMNDPSVYLSLYHTLVRSRLEYCSFVWSPSGQTMRDKLERVQQKFVKFLSFKCKLPSDLSYAERCEYFKLPALDARREMLDLRMVNKLLNNQVDCPELLSRIGFGIPINRSRKRLFVSTTDSVLVKIVLYHDLLHWLTTLTWTFSLLFRYSVETLPHTSASNSLFIYLFIVVIVLFLSAFFPHDTVIGW